MKTRSSLSVVVLSVILVVLSSALIVGCRSTNEAPTISDHPAALDGPMLVDFGGINIGTTKDTTIDYFNSGTHPLHVDQRLTSDVFSVDSTHFDIAGRVTHPITFEFSAIDTVTRDAYDTLVTNSGNYVIHLRGGVKSVASAYDYLFAVCDTASTSTIYRSPDGGQHWIATTQLPGLPRVAQCFAFNRRLFATAGSSLYVSNDFGASWTRDVNSNLTGTSSITGVGVFDSIVYVGESNYVYSSIDGQSWSASYVYGSAMTTFAHLSNYGFGGGQAGLYYSYGYSGSSFYRSYSALESSPIGALGGKDPYLFAAVDGDDIYRSSDNGQTWRAPDHSNAAGTYIGFADDGTWTYFATDAVLMRSRDNGSSWSAIAVPNSSVSAVWGFGRQIMIGNAHGIFRSHDGGVTWLPSSDGMTNTNVRIIAAMKNNN